MPQPELTGGPAPGTGPVALLLHGGGVSGKGRPSPLPYWRMLPFAWALRRAGVPALLLRYRHRGWNGADADPVTDARWALAQLGREVILVGHSMGGRAALWVGGDPTVAGVCALAPWIEPDDPWRQLVDKPLLIVHGGSDKVTSPRRSRALADRAVARYAQLDDGHMMLRRPRQWTEQVKRFVLDRR